MSIIYHKPLLLLLCGTMAVSLGGCPGGGTAGDGTGGSNSQTSNCTRSAVQDGNGFSLDCTVSATRGEVQIDPLDDTNTACTPFSADPRENEARDARLHTLFGQSLAISVRLVIGPGDDIQPDGRTRIDGIVTSGTYTAATSKTRPDCTYATPGTAVSASLGGGHVALIDRGRTPACVFASAYNPGALSVTLSGGGPNLAAPVRRTITDTAAREFDLEIARQINATLEDLPQIPDDLAGRWGRCAEGYVPYRPGM